MPASLRRVEEGGQSGGRTLRHVYETPGQLRFAESGSVEHGFDHVCRHLAPDPANPSHSVFNVYGPDELVALLDEAYAQVPVESRNNFDGVINLHRPVGTARAQTGVRLVIHDGHVTTAYPSTMAEARSAR